MAQTKICNHCNKSKPRTEFHNKTSAKDGLQAKCKQCMKTINENFRVTKPEYQTQWYRKNLPKWINYMKKYTKEYISADESRSALYVCINPEQKVYVGMTQTKFSRRKEEHKMQYKHSHKRQIPLLHASFDMYGWDNHKWYVFEMPGVDRESLKRMESNLIEKIQKQGISLNIRVK